MLFILTAMNRNMDVVEHMKIEEFLKNSAIIVTLITAFFYCSSTVYTHAYLKSLGLDSDVLERSFHAVVYQGFVFNLQSMITISFAIIGIASLRVLLIIPFRRSIKIKRKMDYCKAKFLKFLYKENIELDSYDKSFFIGWISAAKIFILFTLALVALVASEQNGVKAAGDVNKRIACQLIERDKQNPSHAKADTPRVSTIMPSIHQPDSELMFLYCGSRMCAGLDLDEEQVIYFPQTGFTYKRGQLLSQDACLFEN
jgi:hypothetical protein